MWDTAKEVFRIDNIMCIYYQKWKKLNELSNQVKHWKKNRVSKRKQWNGISKDKKEIDELIFFTETIF